MPCAELVFARMPEPEGMADLVHGTAHPPGKANEGTVVAWFPELGIRQATERATANDGVASSIALRHNRCPDLRQFLPVSTFHNIDVDDGSVITLSGQIDAVVPDAIAYPPETTPAFPFHEKIRFRLRQDAHDGERAFRKREGFHAEYSAEPFPYKQHRFGDGLLVDRIRFHVAWDCIDCPELRRGCDASYPYLSGRLLDSVIFDRTVYRKYRQRQSA